MSKIWTKFTGLVVFGLLLGAGQGPPGALAQGQPAVLESWQAPLEFRQVYRPKSQHYNADIALKNEAILQDVLEGYEAETLSGQPCSGNPGQLIACIKAAHNRPGDTVPGLSGFGGTNALEFLESAEMALDGNGNRARRRDVKVKMSGQIIDYRFDETSPGSGIGSGVLQVITKIETAVNGIIPPGMSVEYEWTITVENTPQLAGYKVVPRCDLQGVANCDVGVDPFPDTMDLGQDALDRIICVQQPAACVQQRYKLWAIGEAIRVDQIRVKRGAGAWVSLPNAGINAKFYDRNDENCIDMMFANRPPATLAGMGPPQYCLGRCANPLIVNTGW